jgi:hypothetical protein
MTNSILSVSFQDYSLYNEFIELAVVIKYSSIRLINIRNMEQEAEFKVAYNSQIFYCLMA